MENTRSTNENVAEPTLRVVDDDDDDEDTMVETYRTEKIVPRETEKRGEKSKTRSNDGRIILPIVESTISGDKRLRRKRKSRSRSNSEASSTSSSNSSSSAGSGIVNTWHEHVYAKPPRVPTPHMISDILGWTRNDRRSKSWKTTREQVGNDGNNGQMDLVVERLVAPTSSIAHSQEPVSTATLKEPSILSGLPHYSPVGSLLPDFGLDSHSSASPIATEVAFGATSLPIDLIDLGVPARKSSNCGSQSFKNSDDRTKDRRTSSKFVDGQINKDDERPLNLTVCPRGNTLDSKVSSSSANLGLFGTSQGGFVEPRIKGVHGALDGREKTVVANKYGSYVPDDLTKRSDDGNVGKKAGTPIGSSGKGSNQSSLKHSKTRKQNNSNDAVVMEKTKKEVRIRLDSLAEDANLSDQKKKKARTTFTGRQIFALEKQFEKKKYLSSSERVEMAKTLNVTETQVKIWFQNRRTKWKKHDNITNAEAAEYKNVRIPKIVGVNHGKSKIGSGDESTNSDSLTQTLKCKTDSNTSTSSDRLRITDNRSKIDDETDVVENNDRLAASRKRLQSLENDLTPSATLERLSKVDGDKKIDSSDPTIGNESDGEKKFVDRQSKSTMETIVPIVDRKICKNDVSPTSQTREIDVDVFDKMDDEKFKMKDATVGKVETAVPSSPRNLDNVRSKATVKLSSKDVETTMKKGEVCKFEKITSIKAAVAVDARDRTFRAEHSS